MPNPSHSDLARRLLLETTLFQEETTPETLNALLDQLEVPPAPFSPEAEWARFQKAHPEHFRPRRLPLRAAAACLALTAVLSAAGSSLLPSSEPAAHGISPREAQAVLEQLTGLSSVAGTSLRAELPFDGTLSEGPAQLPTDAELRLLPFYSSSEKTEVLGTDEGTWDAPEEEFLVNDQESQGAP